MTDPETIHRAEQSMLGAMIASPRRARALEVTPAHFADVRHQAIAASLMGAAGENGGLFARLRGFLALRFSKRARETAAYMETLPGLCPDSGHIGDYFAMVSQAKDQRDAVVRDIAEQVATGAQILTVASERLAAMGKTDNATGLPADVVRLARAVNGKTQQMLNGLTAQSASPQAQQGQGQRGQGQPGGEPRLAAASPGGRSAGAPVPAQNGTPVQPQPQNQSTGNQQATATATRGGSVQTPTPTVQAVAEDRRMRPEDLQDSILASLLQHPEEDCEVTGWLSSSAFTEGPRRQLFELISEFARDRRAIDAVTVAWAAGERNSARQPGGDWADGEGWLRPDHILKLGSLAVAPGTATVLARPLLADHLCTERLGADWARQARVAEPTDAPAEGHDLTQEQAPEIPAEVVTAETEREPDQQDQAPSQAGPDNDVTEEESKQQEPEQQEPEQEELRQEPRSEAAGPAAREQARIQEPVPASASAATAASGALLAPPPAGPSPDGHAPQM
jgi:hypothetical protein